MPTLRVRSERLFWCYCTLYCKVTRPYRNRLAPRRWDGQHNINWRYWVPIFYKPDGSIDTCNKDEWPPFAFQYLPATQIIRFLSTYQNMGAGQLWKPLCAAVADRTTSTETGTTYAGSCYYTEHITYTIKAMTMQYINLPPFTNDGLGDNSCVPWTLTTDSGYALLTDDWYYIYTANYADFLGRSSYSEAPDSLLTAGKSIPRSYPAKKKRWLHEPFEELVDMDDIIVNEGNTTRRAISEELLETHGVWRCVSDNCSDELRALGVKEDELQKMPQRPQRTEASPVIATAQVTQSSMAPVTAVLAPSVASTTSRLDQTVTNIAERSQFLAPTTPPYSQ